MAAIQTSKILMRRGAQSDIPGAPSSITPLRFNPGLDVGEIGYALDTGRLFIGHSPNTGDPNYRRVAFPYQNVEVLTENSFEKIRSMFNFLRRDIGRSGFYTAKLMPGDDWQDVAAERAVGAAVPYEFPGENVVAKIEYFVHADYDEALRQFRTPIRQGTLRILTDPCSDEAAMVDDGISMRRTDLTTPFASEPEYAFANVEFRVVQGGTVGQRVHKFQYRYDLDKPARLFFEVRRPISEIADPFEPIPGGAGGRCNPAFALSREDVEDIVGDMVSGNTEQNITVEYDDCAGKLNFVAGAGGGTFTPFNLTLAGDVRGAAFIDGQDKTINATLAATGVVPGTYTNTTVTVDAKGRITAIASGGAKSLGSGQPVYASTLNGLHNFKSLVAGNNVSMTATGDEITISASASFDLDGCQTITNGALTIDTPADVFTSNASGMPMTYDYAGMQVDFESYSYMPGDDGTEGSLQHVQGAAYWYFNAAVMCWTAYFSPNPSDCGEPHPDLHDLLPVQAKLFVGPATSAWRLDTPRKISLAGAVQGSAYFDGSQDIVINTTGGGGGGGIELYNEHQANTVEFTTPDTTFDFGGLRYEPSEWNEIASVTFEARENTRWSIDGVGVFGYNAYGFKAQRHARVVRGDEVLTTWVQPFGEPYTGGQFTINDVIPCGLNQTVTLSLQVGYIVLNPGDKNTDPTYTVDNGNLRVMVFEGSGISL